MHTNRCGHQTVLAMAGLALLFDCTTAAKAQTAAKTGAEAVAPPTSESAKASTTIVITARKPSVMNKIDRRVYDVSGNPQSGFATLNDVLSRIPSVTIDPRGAITLRGNTDVKILVDGSPANAGILRSLPASEIDHIEVMTNPSAQFSSQGSGGLINIVLKKKRKDGMTGMTSLRADDDDRYNVDASANVKSGRWTIGGSAGASATRNTQTDNGTDRTVVDTGDVDATQSCDQATMRRRQAYMNASLGYAFTGQDRLTIRASGNGSRVSALAQSAVTETLNGMPTQVYTTESREPSRDTSSDLSASFEHEGKVEGEQFTLELDHSQSNSSDRSAQHYVYRTPVRPDVTYGQNIVSSEDETGVKGDYERPFSTGARLTAGFSFDTDSNRSQRTTENLSAIVPGQVDASHVFTFKNATWAGYVTYQRAFGKWTVMPGLRVEATRRTATQTTLNLTDRQDYVRWLPSLSLNRALSDELKWVASYSHRTQSPTMSDLDPTLVYYSRRFGRVGNIALKPEDTDSFETGYEFESKAFSSNGGLYYRKTYHPIIQTRDWIDGDTILASVTNASHRGAAGIEFTAKGGITKTLQYTFNMNVFDTQLTGFSNGRVQTRENVTYSGNTVVEYTPTPKDWLQLTYSAQGRTLLLQGYTTGFDRLDMVYRHRFGPRWAFAVRAFDLLNSSKQQRAFQTADGQVLAVSRTQRPGVMLGLAYKFGRQAP